MAVAVPNSLSSIPYLGPLYTPTKKGREMLSLECNETASVIPSLFYDADRTKSSKESVQKLFYKVVPALQLQSDVELMEKLRVDILDHAENRFQLFFQQLFMVYKTNIEFSYSETALHQAGIQCKGACPIALAEAHSSALPCLLFTRDGKQYVFGAGTSFYHGQNMTVKVPEATNIVDTWIDSSSKDFGGISLRNKAGRLIKEVSKSGMNPLSAFQAFISEQLARIVIYEKTHEGDKEKLTSRYYKFVALSYQEKLVADGVLVKSLCFKRKSTKPVDEAFFLEVQGALHTSFKLDLLVAEQREKLFFAKPLTGTQQIYAKIYLNAPEIILSLRQYFSTTNSAQLKTDWKNVVQVTPAKRKGISAGLNEITTNCLELIKETYTITTVNHLGAIIESILYQASISLNPAVNTLYTLPEVANRGPVTRSVARLIPPPRAPLPRLVIVES